ncbi:MAG: ATP-dependent zinc metalloprotease FtsH [Chloroflexi bacterium]|nr:ATP-dependent zinc metalloprotease FtsH [Chloroflexota bacterium]MDA8187226.1 ATP-dependent zinc metalloprotease FtsH [Dehalococcoidales bacterium]
MTDNKGLGTWVFWLVIGAGLLFLLLPLLSFSNDANTVPISVVIEKAKAGQVEKITVESDNSTIDVRYKDGSNEKSRKEPNSSMIEFLQKAGVTADQMPAVEVKGSGSFLGSFGGLSSWLPIILIIGLFLFALSMMRQGPASSDQERAFSFGKSRARKIEGNRPLVVFSDVAGADEAKEELKEIVEFLKHPLKFAALGARVPRGLLLVGPPGTGKTLLARAVAGEAGVPFFSISGSEFVEMFVGVGASRVRDLFNQAKQSAPCIVFIDEIDAVGRQRGTGLGGGHDEREQTLNQILVEMDGFDKGTNVIVIAATNRPDVLDPALLRPGRFDRQVVLDRPDLKGRQAILEVHSRGKPLDTEVNLETLAKQTPGFSGADLENLINEAAILAARRGKKVIEMAEMEEAIDRVIAGPERKSRVITSKEKSVTAHHEAGHAIVAHELPNVDPVHKVSIIPRGMMGGYTRILPTEDRYLWNKAELEDTLAWALGGRAAEELVFGDISTGASNDIDRATEIARKMVCQYGMSDKLGPVAFGHKHELIFLGRDMGEQRNYSDEIAREIDGEIRRLIDKAYQRAMSTLNKNRRKLTRIANALIEKETLEGPELMELLDGPRSEETVAA